MYPVSGVIKQIKIDHKIDLNFIPRFQKFGLELITKAVNSHYIKPFIIFIVCYDLPESEILDLQCIVK